MNRRLIYLTLTLLLLSGTCLLEAQTMSKRTIRKTTVKAENLFDKGEYFKSLQLWEKLLAADSMNAYYNYHAGLCKYNIRRYRSSSLSNFLRAYNKINHDVHYYLGRVYHINEKLELALKEYNLYLQAKGQKTIEESEVRRQINKVMQAQRMIAQPTKAELSNLGTSINSEYPDYVPLISADGKILFFTSRRPGSTGNEVNPYGEFYEDIYQANMEDGKWQNAKNLAAPVNSNSHDACVGLTPEGQTLLIYRTSKSLVAGDIYSSAFDGASWTAPNLISAINTEEYLEPSACYSPDGNTIYFSSNRPGGYGGKDIYKVTKLPNGKWSLPSNLGPNINTPYEEDAPFIHPDGKRLYFSSTGLQENMGGYDVYFSEMDSVSAWGKAKNMGYPLNTVDDDIYFVVTGDGGTGFISSDRAGGSGETDIYKVVLNDEDIQYEVRSGYIRNEQKEPIDAKITLIDNATNNITGIFKTNHHTGKFILLAVPNREYTILVESTGYHSESVHFYNNQTDFEITLRKE